MVFTTVVINGTSMKFLIRALGMSKMPKAKEAVFTQALRSVAKAGDERERQAMKEGVFAAVVWEEARDYYLTESALAKQKERKKGSPRRLRRYRKKGTVGDSSAGGADGAASENKSFNQKSFTTTPSPTDHAATPNRPRSPSVVRMASQASPGDSGHANSESMKQRRPSPPSPLKKETTRSRITQSGVKLIAAVSRPKRGVDASEALEAELRRRILLMCKRSYWNQLEHGLIGRPAVKYLRSLSDSALLDDEAPLDEWSTIQGALSSTSYISGLHEGVLTVSAVRTLELLAAASPMLFGWCHYLAGRMKLHAVELRHNVLLGFLHAREEAVEAVPKLLGEIDVADEDIEVDLAAITLKLHRDIHLAHHKLMQLQETNFEVYSSIATVIAARSVLHQQLVTADKLAHEGLLDTKEVSQISARVNTQMKRLVHWPPFIPLPNAMDVLKQVPWLSGSADATLAELLDRSYDLHLKKGQVLLHQGDAPDVVYIVMRGLLISERDAHPHTAPPPPPPPPPPPEPPAPSLMSMAGMKRSMKNLTAPAAARPAAPPPPEPPAAVAASRMSIANAKRTVKDLNAAAAAAVSAAPPIEDNRLSTSGRFDMANGGGEALSVMHIGFSVNETTWGTGAPSEVTVRAAQPALLLGVPGDVLRDIATAHPEVDDALWLAVGTEVTKQVIRKHALESDAKLAPWQLARIMGNMRLHHTGQYHAQTFTFNPLSNVVLINGSAKMLLKPLLLRALAPDANEEDPEAAAAVVRHVADGGRKWALLRRAMADREGQAYRAGDMITQPPDEEPTHFRIAFDADARFASEEGAIYENPKMLAYRMMVNLGDNVLHYQKRAAATRGAHNGRASQPDEPFAFLAKQQQESVTKIQAVARRRAARRKVQELSRRRKEQGSPGLESFWGLSRLWEQPESKPA